MLGIRCHETGSSALDPDHYEKTSWKNISLILLRFLQSTLGTRCCKFGYLSLCLTDPEYNFKMLDLNLGKTI